jgi:hypothetical protein
MQYAGVRLATLVALTLVVPLALRAANRWHGVPVVPSYLPALEGPRDRRPFDPTPVAELAGMNPAYVIIGDSMAGTRIDPKRLSELAGRPIAPILQAGSGPAWWYLVLKNWVIASGVHPRATFIFFRDTNLTNVMFRLDDRYRWMIDGVAGEREDELNAAIAGATAGRWYRAQAAVASVYGAEQMRGWAEPAVAGWIGRVIVPGRRQRTEFLADMNGRFSLEHLAPIPAADMQAAEDREADFRRDVDRSLLPLMIRDARAAGLTLCFVRVQRRPVGGRPPYQSPALRRYIRDLRGYVESHGAVWRDDTGDPAMTIDMYEDGDHLDRSARRRYTEIFFERLQPLFR